VLTVLTMLMLQTGTPSTPMDRAAQRAELFWDQFSAVQCIETVTHTKLQTDGRVLASRAEEFDYVAVLKPRAHGIAVDESRVPRSTTDKADATPLLLTSGFPTLMLLFHPSLRNKFDFEESPGADVPSGTVRIAFRSRPDQPSMSAVKLQGSFFPILWKGFAWIEEATGNVVRIEVSLGSSMEDIGLSELRAEVDYKSIALRNTGSRYYLPTRVIVSARSGQQQWRNVHEFGEYKVFSSTTVTRTELETSKP
jgi:hypothetical protein